MTDVARTIVVDTPLPQVWDYLSDFTSTEEWDPPTVFTERTSGDGGVGTTYRNVSRFLGRSTEVDYLVTEYVEQERLQLRGSATGLDLLGTLTFRRTASGGTEVGYHAEFSPRGATGLAEPFLPVALARLADTVAESLRDSLLHL